MNNPDDGKTWLAGARFGDYEANFEAGELRKHGLRIKIQEKPLRLLQALVERPGQIVTREELRGRVWPSDVYVDFDANLKIALNKLRTALCDSAESPHYIETLPRQGYRFIAPLERINSASAGRSPSDPSSSVLETSAPPGNGEFLPASMTSSSAIPRVDAPVAVEPVNGKEIATHAQIQLPRRRLVLGMGIVAASLAVLTIASLPRSSRVNSEAQSSRAATQVRLVVLPFENLSGDAKQDYFSDGMTEELSTQIGNLNPLHLTVVGRTSAMTYKNSSKTVREIGKELDVDYVVEGSVRKSGNTVRITAQLLRTVDDSHIWAQDYDRDGLDLLALETDIAQVIASRVGISLVPASPQSRPHYVPDVEAYDEYLQGRFLWNQRDPKSVEESIAHFERAIRRDPSWAPAYAGLADALFTMDVKGHYRDEAAGALDKALQLDPNLAEAHASLGSLMFYGNWDWAGAEQEYRRAIELNPNYPMAHHWYSEYLADRGRFDAALSEAQKAQRLDPLSPILNVSVGWNYWSMHQPDRAIVETRRALEITPNSYLAYELLGLAQEQKGLYSEAIAAFQKSIDLHGNITESEIFLAHSYAVSGRRREAIQMLNRLIAQDRGRGGLAIGIAIVYVGFGDRDRAFQWLDRAYRVREWSLFELRPALFYDPIRSDPRFQKLLLRVGLPG